MTDRSRADTTPTVKVWDAPVRLFHWLLVLLIVGLWYSGVIGGLSVVVQREVFGHQISVFWGNMDIHMMLGQAVLVLVVFRVLWGVVGSSTARFTGFVRGPRAVLGYVSDLLRGRVPVTVGHNPGGALAILLMLALLLLQGGLGLFANDDIFSQGPLANQVDKATSDRLSALHRDLFHVLLIVVAVHVAAALYYLARGKNLIGPMVTGHKKADAVPPEALSAPPRLASPWRAVPVLVVAVLAVWWVVS